MYRKTFQKDYLTILSAEGPHPLRAWDSNVSLASKQENVEDLPILAIISFILVSDVRSWAGK